MRLRNLLLVGLLVVFAAPSARAACTPTGYSGLTAFLVNPTETVTGVIDATGCNIGVYFNSGMGKVEDADISGANYFGVFINGDVNVVSVDVLDSSIHNIGESPLNGAQHGVAVYYRGFNLGGSASGTVSGNTITRYQKGGIVANGQGTSAVITDNTVTGEGPVGYIAQNGIQVGYGANASVMRNTVSGNSYNLVTNTQWASGGIIVVGGVGYGTCPDGNACPYTIGTRIVQNLVTDNDVGIWLSNLGPAPDYSAPTTATNIKVVNNKITNSGVNNSIYQAGISDVGNNDKLINNDISGPGCDPASVPGLTFAVDADTSFTNRPKVHANTFDGEKTN